MSIEIRELVNIVEDATSKTSINSKDLSDLKKQIVKKCTEKVISKLEINSER